MMLIIFSDLFGLGLGGFPYRHVVLMVECKFVFSLVSPALCGVSYAEFLVYFFIVRFIGQRLVEFGNRVVYHPAGKIGIAQAVVNRGLLLYLTFRYQLQRLAIFIN